MVSYFPFLAKRNHAFVMKLIYLQIISASIILVQNSPCKLNRYNHFLWFLMPLFTETKDKIIVTQCCDHFMFLQHQLSKGRGAEWRILTSLPLCPGESLSDRHQTQRAPKEPILITQHTDPVTVSYLKPTKQYKHTPKKGKTEQVLWTQKLL